MLSGSINIEDRNNPSPFKNILPAHSDYVELGTVETDALKICIIVERDVTKKSIAENYYGQIVSQKKYEELKKEILEWSLQSVIIEQFKTDGHIEIIRNHQDTCSLFLFPKGTVLYLHWDPIELYRHLDVSDLLDIKGAITFLELLERRRETTVFKGVFRLLERGRAVFENDNFDIIRPPHIDPPEAVPLKDGADPIAMFHDLIRQSIARWPIDPDKVSSILSSGLDTTIAAYLLQEQIAPDKLPTLGYCGIDKDREAIRDMRIETLGHIDCDDYYPNVEDKINEAYSLRTNMWWPEQSEVDFAEYMLARKMQSLGITFTTTGMGGDELGMLTDKEREVIALRPKKDMAPGDENEEYHGFSLISKNLKSEIPEQGELAWPDGYAAESVSDMANGVSFLYLRHGIWCAHPLAAVELQIFSKFLPVEWRRNRRISRDALTRLGWSENFTKQLPKESLIGTLDEMILSVDWDNIFKDSILCDLGIVDKEKLLESIDIVKRTFNGNVAIKLMMAVQLELSLQSVYKVQALEKAA